MHIAPRQKGEGQKNVDLIEKHPGEQPQQQQQKRHKNNGRINKISKQNKAMYLKDVVV